VKARPELANFDVSFVDLAGGFTGTTYYEAAFATAAGRQSFSSAYVLSAAQ